MNKNEHIRHGVPTNKTINKRQLRTQVRPNVDMVMVLANVEDPVNVGSVFRIADALRVSEVILGGITSTPPHRLITKVGRGKDQRVPWRKAADLLTALIDLAAAGYQRVAVELAPSAVPYHTFHYSPQRLCLIVGHEEHGVPKKLLQTCDASVFIPMFGKGASLNVHTALGIVAYHAMFQQSAQSNEHTRLNIPAATDHKVRT